MKDKTKNITAVVLLAVVLAGVVLGLIVFNKDKNSDRAQNEFIVIFDSNGGSTVKSQTVSKNSTVSKPENPIKPGFTFLEWQYDGKTFDFSTPITKNITLVAAYSVNEGTELVLVTFDYQNGEEARVVEIAKGYATTEPPKPTRQGYEFVAWYLSDVKFDFSTEVTENITLIAEWTVDTEENGKDTPITSNEKTLITDVPDAKKDSGSTSKITDIVEGEIPAGGQYVIRKNGNDISYLNEGDRFPNNLNIGDYFSYGDYRYEYVCINGIYGWDVYAESLTNGQQNKSYYGEILRYIDGFPIIAMTSTFHSCTNLKVAPKIPSTVIDMTQTFHSCTSLISAPKLPKGLVNLIATFCECSSLKTYDGAASNVSPGDFSSYFIPSIISDVDIESAFLGCPKITKLPIGNKEENTTSSQTTNSSVGTTKPTTTTTKPATTKAPSYSDVRLVNGTETISGETINTDIYITSTGVLTLKNVTVNGNIYCYGQLTSSGTTSANNVYAYQYGSMLSCDAFDGTHGKVTGSITCNSMVIKDTALDFAFNKWGKK